MLWLVFPNLQALILSKVTLELDNKQFLQNKTKNFRLRQYYEVIKRAYRDMREIWRFSALDKLVLDGDTDIKTKTKKWTVTWSHESSKPADRVDVTVTHGGHGDDGPVEGGGHGVEHGAGLILLPDIGLEQNRCCVLYMVHLYSLSHSPDRRRWAYPWSPPALAAPAPCSCSSESCLKFDYYHIIIRI